MEWSQSRALREMIWVINVVIKDSKYRPHPQCFSSATYILSLISDILLPRLPLRGWKYAMDWVRCVDWKLWMCTG